MIVILVLVVITSVFGVSVGVEPNEEPKLKLGFWSGAVVVAVVGTFAAGAPKMLANEGDDSDPEAVVAPRPF